MQQLAARPDRDRRMHRREAAQLFITYGLRSGRLGISRDVSLSGLFVCTDSRPPAGSNHELYFVWGDDGYTCRCEVTRHGADGIGLRFVTLDPRAQGALREIVDGPAEYGSWQPTALASCH